MGDEKEREEEEWKEKRVSGLAEEWEDERKIRKQRNGKKMKVKRRNGKRGEGIGRSEESLEGDYGILACVVSTTLLLTDAISSRRDKSSTDTNQAKDKEEVDDDDDEGDDEDDAAAATDDLVVRQISFLWQRLVSHFVFFLKIVRPFTKICLTSLFPLCLCLAVCLFISPVVS